MQRGSTQILLQRIRRRWHSRQTRLVVRSKAFDRLTSTCNSCHRAAGIGFIAIRAPRISPVQTSPFSDESFPPRRARLLARRQGDGGMLVYCVGRPDGPSGEAVPLFARNPSPVPPVPPTSNAGHRHVFCWLPGCPSPSQHAPDRAAARCDMMPLPAEPTT
jgi:hypothetical protein